MNQLNLDRICKISLQSEKLPTHRNKLNKISNWFNAPTAKAYTTNFIAQMKYSVATGGHWAASKWKCSGDSWYTLHTLVISFIFHVWVKRETSKIPDQYMYALPTTFTEPNASNKQTISTVFVFNLKTLLENFNCAYVNTKFEIGNWPLTMNKQTKKRTAVGQHRQHC